jgi:hypothetical protein
MTLARLGAMCVGSFIVVSLAGCGGTDDRPDLEASPTTVNAPVATEPETGAAEEMPATASATPGGSTRLTPRQSRSIPIRADEIEAAVADWDDRLDACAGPTADGDDPAATCTRAAWEQLFDQMDVAQYYLLRLLGPLHGGACHESLTVALDAVHGFLSGAVPTNVVWLDDQQQPPSRFDLESIVDLVRPVPAQMRTAAATARRS